MSETTQIIQVLKQSLKASNITYADLAAHLELTESSVKRLFSEQNFSLTRLEAVCDLAKISMSDLFLQIQADKRQIESLTEDQEFEIISNKKLLLVLFLVLNHYSFEEILSRYKLETPECIQLLIHLERIELIELLPNNRYKLMIGPNFSWLEKGPIQKFFKAKIQHDFFASDFSAKGETLVEINGMLSEASNQLMSTKMADLGKEFTRLADQDATLSIAERQVNSLVMAMRAWEIPYFDELRR